MRLIFAAAILLLASVPSLALAQAAHRVTLQQLRNTTRPLLVFSPAPGDGRLKQQMELIAPNAADARERNIVLVPAPGLPDEPHVVQTYALADEQGARTRFRVGPGDFVVILLGKDGGEKLRSGSPISFETLRSTIDAMPMRQEEARRAKP